MNQLKMNVGGIKCDNKDCDFKDMEVLFRDYDKWLNKPCPKCGSNLLTRKDFNNTKLLVDLTTLLKDILPESEDGEEMFKMSANFDGTGKVVFSEIEPLGEIEKEGEK